MDKGCDWILANKVEDNNAFSSDKNKIYFFDQKKKNRRMAKNEQKDGSIKTYKKNCFFF